VSQTNDITWVLFVGQQPETVDFSDPALPPGLDAEKIHPGIALGMKHLAERGWHADLCLVAPDETATETLELQLAARSFDCVVIGGGTHSTGQPVAVRETSQRCAQVCPYCIDRVQHRTPGHCRRGCPMAGEPSFVTDCAMFRAVGRQRGH
jgi:hypothetical protein